MSSSRLTHPFCHFRLVLLFLLASVLPGIAQNAIQPTSVMTTSMWDTLGLGGHKDKMIDGSGLSGPGSVLTQGHDNNSNVNSWHVGHFPGGIPGGVTGTPPYGAPPPVNTQAVEFDLGANYNLSAAHIWNFNAAGFTGRGVKDVQILVSSDTTSAFTALTTTQFTQATGAAGLAAQVVPLTGASNVRRVRFSIQTAWSGLADEYVGLSEVRFEGTPGTNTAPSFALPLGPAGVVWTPREANRNWSSITSSADGSKLAAVVSNGQIYSSTNSGETWTPRMTDADRNWSSITSSADGSKLAAAVSNGQIYSSTNSGETWTPRMTDANRNWSSITSSADGSKLAAAVGGFFESGQIYTSTNSGETWTPRMTDANRNWISITSSADGSKLAAAVGGFFESGQIYTSTNSGETWTPRMTDANRNWLSITSSADGSKLAATVTSGGQIYTSTNYGANWTPRESNRFWGGITSSADGSKLAAVAAGIPSFSNGDKIYTSSNSGATWTPRESNRFWWAITSSADGGKLAAVDQGGKIYTTIGASAEVSVAAGSGAYSQAAFATSISPGPAAESGQTVSFSVTGNTNPALFSTLPAISDTGTLTFTPASPATTAGTAIISVQLVDNGGTANGGVDTSPVQTFTIKVIPVLTGIAITPTAVTTTSQWVGPTAGVRARMIDGSGLSGSGSVLTQTHDALVSAASMWHAGPDAGGIDPAVPAALGNPPPVNNQAIEFDLGANYNLTGAHIWNFNGTGVSGRGVKDVQILVSSSASGTTWTSVLTTTQFDRGTDDSGLAAQIVPLSGATNVRRVRFEIQSAWSGAANEYVGLSEVRFQGTAAVVLPNGTYAVTTLADDYTTPVAGSLRAAINLANAYNGAAVILFDIPGGGTINLAANAGGDRMLPILTNPNGISINGTNGGQGAITIDGGLSDRIFFLGVPENTPAAAGGNLPSTASTNFSIANLTLQNGQARGGDGSPVNYAGSGGGAGLGGAIFLNAGALSLTNVSLSGNRAVGGNGSAASISFRNGGGGGMGGRGGAGDSDTRSGGGGGGFGNSAQGGTIAAAGGGGVFTGARGGGAGSDNGGAGGPNGGGGGAGGIDGFNSTGGGGGIGGQVGDGSTGGAGGFGGGGGAYGSSGNSSGGAGGYGGGGSGGIRGGSGGFGGGGGGSRLPVHAVSGGFGAGAGGYGTNVDTGSGFPMIEGTGGGGGGLGAGGAIFVRQGATLTIAGCVISGNTVEGGIGGAGSSPGTPGGNGSAMGPDVFSPPTVTTAAASAITASSATLGGDVTFDFGASVSDRGIVWATTTAPTTASNKVANGTGTGVFSATVTGLPPGSTVFVRAYAINSGGTSYGSQISFTTPSTNADLSDLTTTAGAISPAFAAGTIAYTASVPNATTSTTVTATRADANATLQVQVNGGGFTTLTSGVASGTLALTVGSNTVQVLVTAQDGTTMKTYTLTVTRAAAPPANVVTVAGSNLGLIPDNDTTGREILFNVVGAPGVVKTVSTQFTFNPQHAWMADLRIQLISPNGTSAWIYQASESQGNDLLGPYTIADTGTASLQVAATGLAANATLASGTYRAANGATLVSLNLSFAGTSPNGTWKLRFVDSTPPDTTSVSQASLTLTTASPGKTTIQRETNGHMTLNLTAADPSANYDLQRSTDLLTWTLLQGKITNASGVTSHTDTAPPAPKGFYRYIPVVPVVPDPR